jgi:hypothetical protein
MLFLKINSEKRSTVQKQASKWLCEWLGLGIIRLVVFSQLHAVATDSSRGSAIVVFLLVSLIGICISIGNGKEGNEETNTDADANADEADKKEDNDGAAAAAVSSDGVELTENHQTDDA